MTGQMTTEFRLVGREYDGGLNILAPSFPRRMINIVIQEAVRKYGADNALIPTDVHFIPVTLEGEWFFAVRAWHETAAPQGSAGVLQPFLENFEVVVGEDDAFLRARDSAEQSVHYKLTTAETLGLLSLSQVAAVHDALAAPADQERA